MQKGKHAAILSQHQPIMNELIPVFGMLTGMVITGAVIFGFVRLMHSPVGIALARRLQGRSGEIEDPILVNDDVVVVNRSGARAALRDSLFRDILDTINPFSYMRPGP